MYGSKGSEPHRHLWWGSRGQGQQDCNSEAGNAHSAFCCDPLSQNLWGRAAADKKHRLLVLHLPHRRLITNHPVTMQQMVVAANANGGGASFSGAWGKLL